VGLAGSLCGVLSIRCDSLAARIMAARMLGISPEELHDNSSDTCDALGEIANMVAGNFKGKLSGIGNHCMLSVPTIIAGSHYESHSLLAANVIEVVFEFEKRPLWITLEQHE
jgi:chemotaxis protein CheX